MNRAATAVVRAPRAGRVASWAVLEGEGVEAGTELGAFDAGRAALVRVELALPGAPGWTSGVEARVRRADGVEWRAEVEGVPQSLESATRRLAYRLRIVPAAGDAGELPVAGTPLEVRVPLPFVKGPKLSFLSPSGPLDYWRDQPLFTFVPQWTDPRWVAYACHADAPWLSERLRQRIHDFVTVLRCRFPTVQDTRSPGWAKAALRGLASWRYALRRYDRPWELEASQRFVQLLDPRATSI